MRIAQIDAFPKKLSVALPGYLVKSLQIAINEARFGSLQTDLKLPLAGGWQLQTKNSGFRVDLCSN